MDGSLYIHIPFCQSKCAYCDFLSVPYDPAMARRYVEALKVELKMRGGGTLNTLYIGGGTPTVLEADALKELIRTVVENFALAQDVEFTVEANPGTLGAEKVRAMMSLGVNRISVGVQSFNNAELRTLGRTHTARQAAHALESIGLPDFSVDLIYGIPGQTLGSWRKTLRRAIGFGPTHVSAYELTPEPNTPFYEALNAGQVKKPDDDTIVEMFDTAHEELGRAGYAHYEISNFALEGHECRHNLNYWMRGEYLGTGAGAHSFISGVRSVNADYVFKYIEQVEKGVLPMQEQARVSAEEEIKEIIFLGLRMRQGLDVSKMGFIADAATSLTSEGLMQLNGHWLSLTRRGMLLSNQVFLRLFHELKLG